MTTMGLIARVLVLFCGSVMAYPHTCATARVRGLSCDDENVTTSDGYILQVHVVSSASSVRSRVVMLQHGLIDTSETWVANYGNGSLAVMLAEAGWTVLTQRLTTRTTLRLEWW